MSHNLKNSILIEIKEILQQLPKKLKHITLHVGFTDGGALIYSIDKNIDYTKAYHYNYRYIFNIDLTGNLEAILTKINNEINEI